MKPTRTTILIIVSAMLAGLGLPASPAGAAPPGPDEAIAFWTPRDGNREIYLTRADGTGLLGNFTGDPIAEDIDPAWSPDGTRIAFARRLVNKTTYDLFVMSSEGGGLQRVTTNSVDDRQPAWSPDGARIAFARGSGGDGYSQIFVINADGTGETPLTAAKAGKLDAEPTWSPDGTQIAFASDRDGTLTEIYTMFSDGSAQTKRTFNACIDSNPSWSPNGSGIAFDRLCPGESSDIWTMNATGGAQKNVTNTPSQEEFDPDWSPDGTRIAFGGYPVGGGNRDIYTMVADGSGVTRITDNPLSDLGPDWHRFPLPRCTVVGTTGDNVLTGTDGIDVICGLGGHDELSGLGGSDTLRGGDGKDFIKGGNGDDVFDGGLGADWADYSGVSGSAGVTVDLSSGTATGPQGTDTLVSVAAVIGSVNADTITGSAEDNTLDGGPGDDILNGGGGNDTADYSDAIKGVTVNLAGQGQPQATGQGVDTLSAFEHLTGSVHGDRLIGDGGANRLDGGEGGDTLAGAGGDDSLIGRPGDDVLDGGEGSDVGDYTQAPGGVTVNLSVAAPQPTGGAGSDHLAGIENLSGSGFPDRLVGSGSANTLTGWGSDDTLEGGDGKDLLQGGDGNDTLNGGDGDDRALGETGNDILAGSDGDDEVRGGIGQDNLSGDQGVDRLFGDSEGDVAAGGGGDDQVQGNDGPDVLSGGEGNDDVRGGAGGDRLTGEAGADKLIGEGGRDTITGGKDSDLLSGGDGNDRLLARDRLRDRVNGGPGNDRGAIDRGRDRVSGLESATKRRRGFRQRKRKIAQGVTLARIRAPGPRRIYVLTVRPKKAPSIEVALAQNALQGFERTSQMARRHRALAAINGDFGLPQGRPAHHFAKDGDLKQSSRAFGYNFAISRDELSVFLDRPAVSVNALETDVGEVWPVQRWNDGLPVLGEIAGHSPAGGILETPPTNTCSVRMVPSGPLRWGDAQVGLRTDHVVQEVSCAKAALPLNGGIVLSARPLSDEARLIRSLAPGEVVTLSWSFGWRAVLDSVGGFPLLVKDGAVVAKKCAEAICGRHPRTGVGITADGRLLLITVDGRRRGHSVGMTLTEFAREFERLGATWALNLDGGGSSTMVVRGKVVNRPSDKGRERFVSSAILVLRGPDVDEPAPLAAGAGGMGGEKRAWAGARSPSGSVGNLLAVRDPASTGGFLDALAGGELSPPGVRLPMDLRQLVRLFRSGR